MSEVLAAIGAVLELDTSKSVPMALDASLPKGFRLVEDGLWWEQRDKEGEAKPPIWICGHFEVLGLARDGLSEGWSVVIEFRDPDGRRKREIIGREELAGDGAEVRRRLLRRGLTLSSRLDARPKLQAALLGLNTSARVRLEASTGWKGEAYVLPHRTLGATAAEPVLFQGRTASSYHAESGQFEQWRREVAAPMAGNSLGVFAVSAALAAPLLRELGGEGGGFHLRGSSSKGKSTLQRVAGSVWGGGGELGYSQSWRHTDNALDAVALAHNDCLLTLDEIKVVGPEAAGQAAYALATGIMKGRLRPDGDARERPTWRVLILSSGEMGLADLIRQSKNRGERAYTGQELRLQDVAVDLHPDQGVWERLPNGETGKSAAAAFSLRLRQSTDKHYGWAGPALVERYLRDRARLRDRAAVLKAGFLATVLDAGDTGQIRRGAERFALVAAAGELAAELDVLPWPGGEASARVAEVFHRWAAGFGRTEQHEDREAITRLRDFLQRYEHSRFRVRKGTTAEDELYAEATGLGMKPRQGEARSLDAAGWRDDEGETIFHIFPATWKDIFLGMDPIVAGRAVKAAGFLVSNGKDGRLSNRVSIGNRKESFYSVSAAIMGADTEGPVHSVAVGANDVVGTANLKDGQALSNRGSQVHTVPGAPTGVGLGDWEERAAVLEHEGGYSREEAERLARSQQS